MLLSPLQFEGEEGSSVGERVVISRVWKPNLATMSADALEPALVVAEQHGADDAMEIIQNNFNEYPRNKLEKFGVSTNAAIQGNLLPRPTRTPSPRAECKRPHLGPPCNRRLMATMSADAGPMMAAQNLSDRSIPTPNRAQAPMSPEEEEATANIDDKQSLEATEPMGFDWIHPTADDVRQGGRRTIRAPGSLTFRACAMLGRCRVPVAIDNGEHHTNATAPAATEGRGKRISLSPQP